MSSSSSLRARATTLLVVALLAGACSSTGAGPRDAGADAGAGADADAAATLDTGGGERRADAGADGDAALPFPIPMAVQVPSVSAPRILPAGTNAVCLPSADATGFSDTCWVVKWGAWTYWVLTYTDSRLQMLVTPFDAGGARPPGTTWPKILTGARYVWQITVDADARTVTFYAQGTETRTMSWADLYVDQPGGPPPAPDAGTNGDAGGTDAAADAGTDVAADATADAADAAADAPVFDEPTAVQVAASSAPAALPAGAEVACVVSDSDTTASPSCWVVKWGRWTYWAFSYADNRDSLLITPYDETGAAAATSPWPEEKTGSRYLWQASVDATAQTATFSGQGGSSATLSWAELRIDQPVSSADASAAP